MQSNHTYMCANHEYIYANNFYIHKYVCIVRVCLRGQVRQISEQKYGGKKKRILYRERDYHGTTITALRFFYFWMARNFLFLVLLPTWDCYVSKKRVRSCWGMRVCVCVSMSEKGNAFSLVCVCVCLCAREREKL